jgi:predicted PurR-regulated permease PerM
MFGFDPRVARAVFTAVLVLAALYCVYAIRTTLQVVVFAVFFSYMVYPLVSLTERWLGGRVPRAVLVAIAFALVLGAIMLAVGAFGKTIAAQAAGLAEQLPRLFDPATLAHRLPLPGWLEPLRDRLAAMLSDIAHGVGPQALPAAQRIGAGVVMLAGHLIYVVVIPILSFLMILQAPSLLAQLRARPNSQRAAFWGSLARDLNLLLARYVRALLMLSLASFIAYGAVLSVLGVPFALFLAGVAAVLEFIPVFGPLVAALSILTVAVFSGYPHVLWLIGFFVLYRTFQDYALSPYLMSEGVDVPAIAVVFGLLAGDELAGVAGIFLSVPVIAALRIVVVRMRRQAATRDAQAEDAQAEHQAEHQAEGRE